MVTPQLGTGYHSPELGGNQQGAVTQLAIGPYQESWYGPGVLADSASVQS